MGLGESSMSDFIIIIAKKVFEQFKSSEAALLKRYISISLGSAM